MSSKTDDLLTIIESLPIDVKTELVEKILASLHPTEEEVTKEWIKEAEHRVNEIKAGNVKTIFASSPSGHLEILKEFVAQGYSGNEMIKQFEAQNKNVKTAVGKMLGNPNKIASSNKKATTFNNVFDVPPRKVILKN